MHRELDPGIDVKTRAQRLCLLLVTLVDATSIAVAFCCGCFQNKFFHCAGVGRGRLVNICVLHVLYMHLEHPDAEDSCLSCVMCEYL